MYDGWVQRPVNAEHVERQPDVRYRRGSSIVYGWYRREDATIVDLYYRPNLERSGKFYSCTSWSMLKFVLEYGLEREGDRDREIVT